MKIWKLSLCAAVATLGFATAALADAPAAPAAAAPAAPAPAAEPFPAMSASLSANTTPTSFDLGFLGSKVYVGGVLTGFAQAQTNPVFNGSTGKKDQSSTVDLSNAQIFINKSDGVIQYFIQAGAYSLPALGAAPYTNAANTPKATFGDLSQGFVKIVPNANFSVQAGALPTLVGAEYTFTFENLNITRGLLWGVEPAVSRGVQANLTEGPVAVSLAWTDGFYSNHYNTVSGLATWTVNAANTLAFDFQTPTNKTTISTLVTSPVLNNETIYNLMYTHTVGAWTFNPYLQYVSVPTLPKVGYTAKETSWGAALLASYAFDAKSKLAGVSLPFRVEYMSTSGATLASPNLLFGQGGNAWSFTVTPTYQYKNYFIRGEVAYVTANKFKAPDAYGVAGDRGNQTRGLIETGILF